MQFSGKITNSVLVHLTRLGWDHERVFELTEIPLEFLRDPTSWVEADAVESFLRAVESQFNAEASHFVRDVGHAGVELRGWGVLDSVLRMMKKPQDIYTQPQRFISYFISPAPPIVNLRHGDEQVSFELPIAHNEYPCTVAYLSAALEGLPRYWGQETAQVVWRNTLVKVAWSTAQNALLVEPHSHRPELVENLVRGVEMAQAQVEARDLEIARLEQEIRELRVQASKTKMFTKPVFTDDVPDCEREKLRGKLFDIRENVLRLTDYLTRSQQALTMARTAHRQDPQVQAVLKRIDWETIRAQYPWLHLQIMEGLNAADLLLDPKPAANSAVRAGRIDIEALLGGVVDRLETGGDRRLHVKAQSFVTQPVMVDADRLHVVLWQLLSAAARGIHYRGDIEILARLEGNYLEVSVAASGEGLRRDRDHLPLLQGDHQVHDAGLASAAELIQQQKGHLIVRDEHSGQRRYICQWPLPLAERATHEPRFEPVSP